MCTESDKAPPAADEVLLCLGRCALPPRGRQRRRAQSAAARGLLQRSLLQLDLAQLDGSALDISPTTPYPALEQQVLAASGRFPSLSHSGSWLAVALGRERLGLDIEGWDIEGLDAEGLDTARRQRPRDWLAIANQCFAQQDQAALQAAPTAERAALGYRIWTLKEAAVKLGGGSLFGDLNRLRYHRAGQVALDWPDDTPRWTWSGQCAGLSLALCGLGPQPRRVRLYCEGSSPGTGLEPVEQGQLEARFVPVL